MNEIRIDKTLAEFLLNYLVSTNMNVDRTTDLYRAIKGLEWALQNQTVSSDGTRVIENNPSRTDIGMGPILSTSSEFL